MQSRISKEFFLLWVAVRCTVLRSRWYHSGIRRGPTTERPTGAARRETVEMIREALTKKGKVDAGLHR